MAGQRRQPSFEVDTADFGKRLRKAVDRLELRSEADLLRFGLRIQNSAREFCPVDTGRLRSSIQAVPGRDTLGPYVEIGTNVEYAVHVEYGTKRAHAQPFLRPAFAEGVGAFKAGGV